MITTQAGEFEADSPFLNAPWQWGEGDIGVSRSRDNNTLIVQPIPQAKVESNPVFGVQAPPLAVGTYVTITGGEITYVGSGPEPTPTPTATPTLPPPTATPTPTLPPTPTPTLPPPTPTPTLPPPTPTPTPPPPTPTPTPPP